MSLIASLTLSLHRDFSVGVDLETPITDDILRLRLGWLRLTFTRPLPSWRQEAWSAYQNLANSTGANATFKWSYPEPQ